MSDLCAERLEPLVKRAFRSLQSTSAGSLLMLSLDIARSSLAVHGRERIGHSLEAAARLRAGIRDRGRSNAELSARGSSTTRTPATARSPRRL